MAGLISEAQGEAGCKRVGVETQSNPRQMSSGASKTVWVGAGGPRGSPTSRNLLLMATQRSCDQAARRLTTLCFLSHPGLNVKTDQLYRTQSKLNVHGVRTQTQLALGWLGQPVSSQL